MGISGGLALPPSALAEQSIDRGLRRDTLRNSTRMSLAAGTSECAYRRRAVCVTRAINCIEGFVTFADQGLVSLMSGLRMMARTRSILKSVALGCCDRRLSDPIACFVVDCLRLCGARIAHALVWPNNSGH